ncbi:MAG: Verru_Chthon cassette protein A [bacterium]
MKFILKPPVRFEWRSGSALLIVLGFLLLISALALAFFATTTTQRNAAKSYSDSGAVRHLANSALELVFAQIADATAGAQLGSNGAPDPTQPLAWASQPGMIRTFDTLGRTYRFHKLYSAGNTTVSAFTLADDLPPTTWKSSPGVWVDLNAPVADSTGTLNYPILDPAASTPTATVNATGFSCNASVVGYSGGSASSTNNPAPMPVRWLYVLQNGTLVPGTGSGNTTTVTGATTANPIIGRIAFWADDETCKVNVNTAAEGTFWDTPRFRGPNWASVFSGGVVQDASARSYPDLAYAAYQPALYEFQRYPGHPAQVALSSVFPGITSQLAAGVTPRIVWGGSQGGTTWTGNSNINLTAAPRKAPYASLDEFQFSGAVTTPRSNNSAGSALLTKADLEAAKFFITANSRAPELNLFNLPRIACWPVDNSISSNSSLSANRTTAYDRLIAFCSTLRSDLGAGAHRYFFQRSNSQSATADYRNIPRNQQLYTYLQRLTGASIPGFGGSLNAKYPQDRDQILTEIFDYIRCTNLMDPSLGGYPITAAASPNGNWPVTTNQFVQARKTPRDSNGAHLLGSGQVMPIRIGNTTGLGRFSSLSEIGLAFVCVASGELPDTSSITNNATLAAYISASSTTPTNDEVMKLISNIPAAGGNGIPATAPSTVSTFLQSNPMAWNSVRNKWIAAINTGLNKPLTTFASGSTYFNSALSGIALSPGERRIQMIILMTLFSPMAGNSPLYPDLIIQLNGLDSMQVTNALNIPSGAIFPSPTPLSDWLLKVSSNFVSNLSNPLGSDALIGWNTGNALGNYAMPPHLSVTNPSNSDYLNFPFYPFISRPFTMNVSASGATMNFSPVTLTFRIFQGKSACDSRATLGTNFKWSGAPTPSAIVADPENLTQNATITFPAGNFPVPTFPSYTNSGICPWGGNATTGFYWQIQDWLPQATNLKTTPDIMQNAITRSMTYNGDGRLSNLAQSVSNFTTFPDYSSTTANGANNFYYTSPGYASAFYRIGGSSSNTYNTRSIAPGTAVTTGDFDIVARLGLGAYANKPDEGDASTLRCPYFDTDQNASNSKIYTPNRIMPSPGMFGSLPTGAKAGVGWKTLLFRPQPSHPSYSTTIPDHLMMDLFWMPIVEPYAISDPLSTAGKVNMNYQILPFTYINRPTALIGAMRSQMIAALPNANDPNANSELPVDPMIAGNPWRKVLNISEANGSLRQFKEKFDSGGVFRSASEICDIYLTPKGQNWTSNAAADNFWSSNLNTPENLREKPYANLYALLTTKSNTFTVHIRAQALRKVPGTAADQWVEGRDRVVAEERSSTLVERYIDVDDGTLPDFATVSTALLSKYTRMRILSTRRFNP